ncbi:ppg3 [Cystoisospora suis]|uniref:Ppg3 n=1 Tax=Cystoisospora suis TaxID=483139 RepID=A0A2C6L345_9APIC|nr:ppg3 [Cystoisospora suis]
MLVELTMVLVRSPRRGPVLPPRSASPGASPSFPSSDRFLFSDDFQESNISGEGQASSAQDRDRQLSSVKPTRRSQELFSAADSSCSGSSSPRSPSRSQLGRPVSAVTLRPPYSRVLFTSTSGVPERTGSRPNSTEAECEREPEKLMVEQGREGLAAGPGEKDRKTRGGATVESRYAGDTCSASPRLEPAGRSARVQESELPEVCDVYGPAPVRPSVSVSNAQMQGRVSDGALAGTAALSTAGQVAGCSFSSDPSSVRTPARATRENSLPLSSPESAMPASAFIPSAWRGEKSQAPPQEQVQRSTVAASHAFPSSSSSHTTKDHGGLCFEEAACLLDRGRLGAMDAAVIPSAPLSLLLEESPSKKLRGDFQAFQISGKTQRESEASPLAQPAPSGGTPEVRTIQALNNSPRNFQSEGFSFRVSPQRHLCETEAGVKEKEDAGDLFTRTSGMVGVQQETNVFHASRSVGSPSRVGSSPCAQVENLARRLPASRALQEYVKQAALGGGAEGGKKSGAVPRTAQGFLEEWSSLVDATVRRLCDMTEEEKQVTRYIMLEGRMLRAVRHASSSLTRRRAAVSARHSEAEQELNQQRASYEESEREFDVVQRHAETAAGGQEKLERRLKDTQRKREKVEAYRHRMHEKMSALSFARQKKIRLAEALAASKKESNTQEKVYQGIHQLLRQVTRFVVNGVAGGVVTGVLVPDEDLVPPRLLRKRRVGVMPLSHSEQENVDTGNAEPAMLTIDCEKENEGRMDADYLWKLIEETLGIDGVAVADLLRFVANDEEATGRRGGERRKTGKEVTR